MASNNKQQRAPPSYHATISSPGVGSSRDTTPLLTTRGNRRRKQGCRLPRGLSVPFIIATLVITSISTLFIDRTLRAQEISSWKKSVQKYQQEESDLLDTIHGIRQEITNGTQLIEQQRKLNEELRKESEGWQREKKERETMGLYWADITPAKRCTSYNTIEYSALLANLRSTVDPVIACKTTPLHFHGLTYNSPEHCDVHGDTVYGHWRVSNEYKCKTYWESNYRDKGCTVPGSGYRRIEIGFGGVHEDQDWETLCYTTPVDIMHQHFEGAHQCLDWGHNGKWGIWNVRDRVCD